jgi:hypothetical protein
MKAKDLVALNANNYQGRRQALLDRFNKLPRGARMRAAFDLRIPPITVSNILNNATIPKPDTLARLEEWVEGQADGPRG